MNPPRVLTYRAISARAALVGGLLSLGLAGAMLKWQLHGTARNIDARAFFELWALVFLATLASTVLLLWRRGLPLLSEGLKLAVVALMPSFFAGALIGACLTLTSGLPLLPSLFWVIFYGLGLLATRAFAPPAILNLGWAFLITGVGAFIYLMNLTLMPEFDLPTPENYYPAALMGATFGCYHLIYAVCTWRRR